MRCVGSTREEERRTLREPGAASFEERVAAIPAVGA